MNRTPQSTLLLVAILLASGCGSCREPQGREVSPAEERPRSSSPVAVPDGLETDGVEEDAAGEQALRFAPSGRHGWPDDFRLPLHIEIEIPEIPEEIRGPSPPIEAPS